MPIKLEQQELALLIILSELLEGGKEIERDALRVLVASRGVELGRAYFRLSEKGFINEREVRPSFLKRITGAKQRRMISLTTVATDFVTARAAEKHVEEAQDLLTIDIGRTSEPEIVPPQMEQEMAASPAPRAQVRRFSSSDYTETLGGAPLEVADVALDFDLLSGITELLSLLGFELTPAGKLLAEKRAEADVSEAEIALEVLVASVAHAARLGLMGTVRISTGPALARIEEIRKAFSFLVAEGVFDEQRLSDAMTLMREFASLKEPSSTLDDYLADPMRGLAPPSVCPDDMFEVINVDEE